MQNKDIPTLLLKLLDSALICCAAFSAELILDGMGLSNSNVLSQLVLVLVCILVFSNSSKGVYKSWRAVQTHLMLSTIFWRWLTAIGVGLSLLYFSGYSSTVDKKWMGVWSFLSLTYLFVFRVLVYKILKKTRANGNNQKSICVISKVELGDKIQKKLESNPWLGYKVRSVNPVLNKNVIDACFAEGVDEVWLSSDSFDDLNLQEELEDLELSAMAVRLLPKIPELGVAFDEIEFISGVPVINIYAPRHDASEVACKMILDYVVSLVALVLFLPVLIVVAVLIKIESNGPVFFKQKRLGLNGRVVEVLKFRTMVVHESQSAVQAVKNDSRITKVGSVLRKSSIDELPQFINVLKGEMSVVGPRPHPISLNEQFMKLVPNYMKRHLVKPGITGWAQVNGYRGETDTIDKMRKRVEFDIFYIKNWSVWFDLQIIVVTVFKGFFNKNAY